MAIFSYGAPYSPAIGAPAGPIILEPWFTRGFERQAVYTPDNGTYLYTQFRLHGSGTFNPATTAYAGGGMFNTALGIPAQIPQITMPALNANMSSGSRPAVTDKAIRYWLMQPRGQLIYTANADTIVNVLGPDVTNGPLPQYVKVTQIASDHTFRVDLVIDFALREEQTWTGNAVGQGILTSNPLMSHRWRDRHVIDKDLYTSRVVSGLAVLRQDQLSDKGFIADQFRKYVSHPIPQHFRRENVQVQVSEDGTQLSYSFVDREQPMDITPYASLGISRVQGTMTVNTSEPGADADVQALFGLVGAGAAFAAGNLVGGLASSAKAIMGLFASVTININARVWGNRLATRWVLARFAWEMLLQREKNMVMAIPAAANAGPMVSSATGQDLTGNYADANITFIMGPTGSALSGLQGTGLIVADSMLWSFPSLTPTGLDPTVFGTPLVFNGAQANINAIVNALFALPQGVAVANTLVTRTGGANPSPRNSGHMRSEFIGQLLTQVLEQPGQVPPAPPDPDNTSFVPLDLLSPPYL